MATEYKLSYSAEEIDGKLGKIDDAVLYTEQSLTEEQKAQARANMGAADATLIGSSVTIIGVDKYGTKHSFTLYGKEDTPTEATVTMSMTGSLYPGVEVDYNGEIYTENDTFTANIGDTITISGNNHSNNAIVVNREVIDTTYLSNKNPIVYKHTIVSNSVLISHRTDNYNLAVKIEDAPTYSNCTDTNGNILKPIFVKNRYWELKNGKLEMPKGYENSFLLFADELTNNRIEATFVINDIGLWDDANRRCGIVFAFEDIYGEFNFNYDDSSTICYYWAFINDWGCVEVIKMGKYGHWQWLSTETADLYYHYGIDVKQGVTLAAEWDNSGHIKVYANGILVQEVTDTDRPLSGNGYGLLVNNHGNFNPAYGPYDSPVTSFVAG